MVVINIEKLTMNGYHLRRPLLLESPMPTHAPASRPTTTPPNSLPLLAILAIVLGFQFGCGGASAPVSEQAESSAGVSGAAAGTAAADPGGHAGMHHGGAGMDADASGADGSAADVPLYDDLGTYSHPVTTTNPLAQKYFDQGLRLVYGFNVEEGQKAFQKAADLDPDCAMAWWGVAFSLGPDINVPRMADREYAALSAIGKAQAAPHASELEKALIAAIAKRHSPEAKVAQKALDRAYADAMKGVATRFPDDLDVATLYAASLMDLRPWDFWDKEGNPRPETPEILAVLEKVLAKNPNHPGANHFYVHAVEASSHPEKGLDAAGRLVDLMPGAGHLTHMPFHIYIRTGRYDLAVKANRKAIAADRAFIASRKPVGFYPIMYYPHNIQSLWACLVMEGRSAEALEAAHDLQAAVTSEAVKQMPMVEYFIPTPYLHRVRFGEWDAMLAEPQPPADLSYDTAIWHFARGAAHAAKGDAASAAADLKALDAEAAKIPADTMESLNLAKDLLAVAHKELAARILMAKKDYAGAIRGLEETVAAQDALNYDEPPPWYYPVRHSLGALLLERGKPAEAEAVYRKDLAINPENGWSLFGLAASLEAQNKKVEAEAVKKRFATAWARADVTLKTSVM